MLSKTLERLLQGDSLSRVESENAMNLIISDQINSEQISAFLGALRVKGEAASELLGFVDAINKKSQLLSISQELSDLSDMSDLPDLIDTCGTGGDQAGTFNISTAVSFILAAAGVRVAKHGNRSVSSQCGSADLIEALQIRVDHPSDVVTQMIRQLNYGFLFAPHFHPAFKTLVPVRKALGVKTVFNLLGPLVNPARAKRRVLGVYDRKYIPILTHVLQQMGVDKAFVLSSQDGLDEMSLSAPTSVAYLNQGMVHYFTLQPEDFGIKRAPLSAIQGGSVHENLKIITNIFNGTERGPKRDVVLMNASAALLISDRVNSFSEGTQLAAQLVDSGAVSSHLLKNMC